MKIFSLDQLDDWGDDSFHVKVAAEHFRIIHQVAYRKMVHEKYKLIISNCHKYNFCLEWSKFYSRKLQKNQTIFGICLQGVRSFFLGIFRGQLFVVVKFCKIWLLFILNILYHLSRAVASINLWYNCCSILCFCSLGLFAVLYFK